VNILGLSCFYHDAAAALIQEGVLVAAAEEERFSGKKHDPSFPTKAIQFCLRSGGLTVHNLDYVVFYEKPFLKFDRILKTALAGASRASDHYARSLTNFYASKLWMRDIISRELGIKESKILFCEHHLSHAASSFFCSPFTEAAIVTIDGVGEWATTTIGHGKDNQIRLTHEIRFPHSLGLLYSVFTAWLGFEVNEGEYKVMGMAPYGIPRYLDKIRKLVRLADDGSFDLDMDYFSYHLTSQPFNERFVALFGAPRDPKGDFFTLSTPYPDYFGARPAQYEEIGRANQYYADVAASLQAVLEEAVLAIVARAARETGHRKLCLAGGVALNSVANGKILKSGLFDEIYIQPAAGDGGGAVGAALCAYHMFMGMPRSFVMEHAYWGERFEPERVESYLQSCGIRYEKCATDESLFERGVKLLGEGKVVGWYQDRFEWGPRALGNRSILADPRHPEMKNIVNTKIKFREPYRPFAPSVLAEAACDYFDLPDSPALYPARFMLYVVDVKKDKADMLPAITHVDGTARVQAVHEKVSPRYHGLIKRFGEWTGVPVL
jgi:carbamoyltransferase